MMSVFSATFNGGVSRLACLQGKSENKLRPRFVVRSENSSKSGSSGRSFRKVWRRKKLTKTDSLSKYGMERVPFLEEKVRKIRETGDILALDIERLLLSEENRFHFVNEVAAEAKQLVENNRDEYGSKKAILHVISNRMNDAGFSRPEAYMENDPFKPGPGYVRQELYDND